MMNCLRPGCGNELKSGRKYCSPGCSAKDRKRVSGEIVSTSKSYPNVPDNVASLVLEHGGSDIILNEINMLLEEEKDSGIPMPPLMNTGMTLGDWTLSMDGRDYRPYDALSFLKIRDMLRCGAVKFALEMKIAGVASPFRTDTGWVVHSPDKELSDVVESSLRKILLKTVTDILYSSLAYGVSFQELVWERKTKYELGLSDTKDEMVNYVVPKVPNSVNPETVKDILREPKTGKFLGFEQTRTQVWNTGVSPIKVEGEAALVIPYNERFRNLWGESFLLPLYPLWFWYEVIMRSMVRYMHRMATPVTVVKAPGKGKVNKPGTTTPVNSMMLGLAIAGNAANSNALVLPSDVDPETKQPLWDIFYLSHNESTQPFIDILEFLTQSMLRAALSGDRAVSQPMAGVGSKGLGEVHAAFTQLHNELILDQILMFLNFYFLPLYSLYNKGKNGPPVWLETQGLDPLERDNMFKLMGIAGNSQVFQEFFYLVDWKRMAESNSIPVLSEEERDALKAKLDEEALDKQEKFQEVQAKFGPAQKPGGTKDNARPPEQKANAKLENDMYWQAVEKVMNGEPVPIVLSVDELQLIAEHRGFSAESLKLFSKGSFDEDKVKRDSGGRFSKKEDTKAKLTSLAEKISDEESRQRAMELINKADLSNLSPEQIVNTELALGLFGVTKPYSSIDDAYKDIRSRLEEMGITGMQDISSIDAFTEEEMKDGLLGRYNTETNSFKLRPDLIEGIKNGDPLAIHTFAHELLHSDQEVFRKPGEGESNLAYTKDGESFEMHGAIFDSTDPTEISRFMGTVEGQNELLSRVFMGKYLGQEWDSDVMSLHNYIRTGDPTPIEPYPLETRAYSYYLSNIAARTGEDAMSILIRHHQEALDMFRMRQIGISGGNPNGFISLSSVTRDDQANWKKAYEKFIKEAMDYAPKPQQPLPSTL